MSRSKRRLIAPLMLLGLACIVVDLGGLCGAQGNEPAPFEIRLPPEIRSEQVQYVYHLTGPSLNFSSLGRTEPERSSYLIPTLVDRHTADRVQVIVYARGCQIVTLDVHLPVEAEQTTEIPCADLPPMGFHGRVEMPETLRRRPYDVRIGYMPSWQYDFFNSSSGGPATEFRLALVTPDDRGAFDVQLRISAKTPSRERTIATPGFVSLLSNTIAATSCVSSLRPICQGGAPKTTFPSSRSTPRRWF
jgi:hypothetical protein